jgi:hypothetical protein
MMPTALLAVNAEAWLSTWRDTPGPTRQLVAAMLRNRRRELEERLPAPPAQQRLAFA